jgi:hypothetical protein
VGDHEAASVRRGRREFLKPTFRHRTVKTPMGKNFVGRNLRCHTRTKKKSPALPGFLTNFFFD